MQKPVLTAPIRPGQQLFKKNQTTGEILVVNHREGKRKTRPARDLVFRDHNGSQYNDHFAVVAEPDHKYLFAMNMKNAQRKFNKTK